MAHKSPVSKGGGGKLRIGVVSCNSLEILQGFTFSLCLIAVSITESFNFRRQKKRQQAVVLMQVWAMLQTQLSWLFSDISPKKDPST